MPEKKYNVVYAGAIANGFNESDVKASFIKELKIPQAKIDRLFSGNRIVLKRSVSNVKAEKWIEKLLALGAEAAKVPHIEAVNVSQSPQSENSFHPTNDFSQSNLGESNIEAAEKIVQSLPVEDSSLASNTTHEEYDAAMEERIRAAKLQIAQQQMEDSLTSRKESGSITKLIKFSVVLLVLVFFLYFYADLAT